MSTKRLAKNMDKTEAKIKPKQSAQKDKGNEQSKNISSKADERQQRKENRKNKRPVRRIFPIWLRLIVVLLLSGIALILGLMIGYGMIGDGNPMDALKVETWQHIKDIVNKQE